MRINTRFGIYEGVYVIDNGDVKYGIVDRISTVNEFHKETITYTIDLHGGLTQVQRPQLEVFTSASEAEYSLTRTIKQAS